MMRSIRYCFLTACLALFAITSCSDNPASVDEEPPSMPPPESMEMDYSEFNSQNDKRSDSQIASAENFGWAVVKATVLKAIVDINLAIPRALLQAASNVEAEFNGDGEWEWTYTKSEGEHTYSVNLVASVEGENTVMWNFYVTNTQLGLENQLFFRGETNRDGTEGTWSYFSLQNTNEQEEVSTVTWTVDGEESVNLHLEVTTDRNDNQGDYIDYSFDGTTKSAVYYDASDDAETELQINTETQVGFIIAPNYNNGDKACWDSEFQDASCSEI